MAARGPVAVVGAGVAGLACARELAAAGVPVMLFDKALGSGGRACTRRSGGEPGVVDVLDPHAGMDPEKHTDSTQRHRRPDVHLERVE